MKSLKKVLICRVFQAPRMITTLTVYDAQEKLISKDIIVSTGTL